MKWRRALSCKKYYGVFGLDDIKRKIFKYSIGLSTTHEIPIGAVFLDVQMQDDVAVAWFIFRVDEKKTEPRKFKIYGTGAEIPMNEKYLGTFQAPPFVWHLFEDMN